VGGGGIFSQAGDGGGREGEGGRERGMSYLPYNYPKVAVLCLLILYYLTN
jgi:hypothetical protein